MRVEIFRDARGEVAEGPVWDARDQTLWWVDILRGDVWQESLEYPASPGTVRGESGHRIHVETHVGAVLPTTDPDVLLLVVREGFARYERTSGTLTMLDAPLRDRVGLRFNDAKVSPDGRAFATTMPYDVQWSYDPAVAPGEFVRLDASVTTTVLCGGLGLGNGIGWSPSGTTVYVIDSVPSVVYRAPYDRDTGAVGRIEPFIAADVPAGSATDGMCADDDGCLWIAIAGGGRLHRYTPEGRLDRVINVPMRRPTSVCFAGPRLDTLVVTSLSHEYTEADYAADPHAGALAIVSDLGITGPAANLWNPTLIGA